MGKMTPAGGDEDDIVTIGEVDGLLVLLGAAGMDDRSDASKDEEFRGVGEGEVGIGTGDAAGEIFGVAVFAGEFEGDPGGHRSGHLPGACAQQLAIFGDCHRVGFNVLGHQPDEGDIPPFAFRGAADGGDIAGFAVKAGKVGLLHQHAAGDGAEMQFGRIAAIGQRTGGEDAAIFPAVFEHLECGVVVRRGDDNFEKALAADDGLGGGDVHFAVERDDAAAERGADGVTGIGEGQRRRSGCRRQRQPQGSVVLDDRCAGSRSNSRGTSSMAAIGVEDVDVGERLAVELHGRGDGAMGDAASGEGVERARLMRVFAVPQVLDLAEPRGECGKQAVDFGRIPAGLIALIDFFARRLRRKRIDVFSKINPGEVGINRGVILGGAGEGPHRQIEAETVGRLAFVAAEVFENLVVLHGIGDDRDGAVILGGGADHRRTADVDIFDGIFEGAVRLGDGLLEGVEIHAEEVDSADVMGLHGARMVRIVAQGQEAAVDGRVEGFDPTVHHFGEAGDLRDIFDGKAGVAEGFGGAAGGDQLDVEFGLKGRGEFDDTGLIGNGEERPLYLDEVWGGDCGR